MSIPSLGPSILLWSLAELKTQAPYPSSSLQMSPSLSSIFSNCVWAPTTTPGVQRFTVRTHAEHRKLVKITVITFCGEMTQTTISNRKWIIVSIQEKPAISFQSCASRVLRVWSPRNAVCKHRWNMASQEVCSLGNSIFTGDQSQTHATWP